MGARSIRITLVIVDLFAAVSAIAGAVGLLTGGIDIPISELRGTPFADYTVPGLLLGCVVGGSALAALAVLAFGPRRIAPLASAFAGCIMLGWMTVELVMIGLGSWLQPLYLVVGLVMLALAALLQWAAPHQPITHTHLHGLAG